MIKQNEKGFSLIELMMVIAVSSIIMYALATTMLKGNEQIDSTALRMDIQESAREGLYKMTQEIRQSAPTRVVIAGTGNSVQLSVPDPANPVLADYTVNWAGSRSISYALGGVNNRQLIRTDLGTNQARVVANDVTAVNFAGNSANPTLVTITISVQRTMINGKVIPVTPLQLVAQAEVRNA